MQITYMHILLKTDNKLLVIIFMFMNINMVILFWFPTLEGRENPHAIPSKINYTTPSEYGLRNEISHREITKC